MSVASTTAAPQNSGGICDCRSIPRILRPIESTSFSARPFWNCWCSLECSCSCTLCFLSTSRSYCVWYSDAQSDLTIVREPALSETVARNVFLMNMALLAENRALLMEDTALLVENTAFLITRKPTQPKMVASLFLLIDVYIYTFIHKNKQTNLHTMRIQCTHPYI